MKITQTSMDSKGSISLNREIDTPPSRGGGEGF